MSSDFVCVLLKIFFSQYNAIISTSKLPFHSSLVMEYFNFLSIFLKIMKVVILLNYVYRLFYTYTVSIKYT